MNNRIVQLRKEQGLTVRTLSEKIGIPKSALSRYEHDGVQPPLERLFSLAKFFNVSVEYLYFQSNIK